MCADPKLLLLVKQMQGKISTKPRLTVVYATSDINKAKRVLTGITTVSYTPELIDVSKLAAESEEL